MAAKTPTPGYVSATEERTAVVEWYNVATGVTLTLGDAVYLDSNNELNKAIALTSAHARAIGIVAFADNFYGETTIPATGQAGVVVHGPVYGWSGLASGQPLWVSKDTAGGLVDTAPTGAYQYIVGHAQDAQTFFVDPGTVTPVSA